MTQTQTAPKLSEEKLKEWRETFNYFDENGDGTIDSKELGKLMRGCGHNPTESEIRDLINNVDINANGKIEFEEFVTFMSEMKLEARSEMQASLLQAFKVFDKDGDGYITSDELKEVMTNLGERLSDADVEDMIASFDIDHDGKINYDEFVKAMSEGMVYEDDTTF